MSQSSAADPRGWLAQLPGLERFAAEGPIAAAVASGDARKLTDALRARRARPRTPAEVPAIDRILAVRRAFAMPVTKAPGLFTLNGIGSRIYGRSDPGPDGSYIGTLFFTFVFVPLWPLAQYLLLSDGKKYLFLGELPLSPAMRLWRRLGGAAALAGLLVAGVLAFQAASWADVQLLNGLDVPVTVTAGKAQVTLAPGAREARRLPVGATTFRAAVGGRVVEEVQAEIPRFHDLVAYNVGGAAPLELDPVVYTPKDSNVKAVAPAFQPLVGLPFVARSKVDYLFKEPPRELKLEKSAKVTVRWQAAAPEGGWRATVGWLRSKGQALVALAVAAKVAEAQPENVEAVSAAYRLARQVRGPEAALEVARRCAEAQPASLEAQRLLSSALVSAGKVAEARRLYGERAARDPDSPDALYLQARVAPSAEQLRLLQAAAPRFPDHAWLHRLLAWSHMMGGRDAEALAELRRLGERKPEEARYTVDLEARLLVRLDRPAEAARRVLEAEGAKPSAHGAVRYAQLARLAGAGAPRPPGHLLAALPQEPPVRAYGLALAAAVLGDEPPAEAVLEKIPEPAVATVARIHAAARQDPARALKLAAAATDVDLEHLEASLQLLLAGEAAGRGDEPLARRLLLAAVLEAPVEAALAFVRGGGSAVELDGEDPAEQAALHVARARIARAAGRPAAEEERRARELDVLRGAPWNALARWPALKP